MKLDCSCCWTYWMKCLNYYFNEIDIKENGCITSSGSLFHHCIAPDLLHLDRWVDALYANISFFSASIFPFIPPPTAAAPHCKYGAMQQQQRIVNLLSSTKPFYFHDETAHADNADDDHVIWFANETWKRLLLDIRNVLNFIYPVCV